MMATLAFNELNAPLACVYLIQYEVFEMYKMQTVLPFIEAYMVRANYLKCTIFKIKRQMAIFAFRCNSFGVCILWSLWKYWVMLERNMKHEKKKKKKKKPRKSRSISGLVILPDSLPL